MLHRTQRVRGFHLHATDGGIGHIDDVLFDDQTWTVRYLVVDTSNWIGGRTVLVSASLVTHIDSIERRVDVGVTRAQVEAGPSMDAADLPLAETLPAIWIM
jgi:hypothetical protein